MLLRGCLVLWMWLGPYSLYHQLLTQLPNIPLPLAGLRLPLSQAAGSRTVSYLQAPEGCLPSLLIRVPVHGEDRHLMKCLPGGSVDVSWPPPATFLCPQRERLGAQLASAEEDFPSRAMAERKCLGRRKGTFSCRKGRHGGSVMVTAVWCSNRQGGTLWAEVPHTRPLQSPPEQMSCQARLMES